MVVMSMEAYSELSESTELALDAADAQAQNTKERLTHAEVFGRLREKING